MEKLTKKMALRICAELWWWLFWTNAYGERGIDAKLSWPHWNKYLLYTKRSQFSMLCPCCEYVDQLNNDYDCKSSCPLYSFWPNGCSDGAYGKWNYSPGRYYASRIAWAATWRYWLEAIKERIDMMSEK